MMVGTSNKGKLNAVRQAVASRRTGVEIVGTDTDSGVPDQPLGWFQTETGARNRAHTAYKNAVSLNPGCRILSLGIESGIVKDHEGKEVDITIVAIYDGTYMSIAASSPTPVPEEHMDLLEKCRQDQSLTFGKMFAPLGKAIDGTPLSHDDWHRYIGPSRYQLIQDAVKSAFTGQSVLRHHALEA